MEEYLPIEELIADIQVDLGFQVEKLRPQITRWIYEAINQIGVQRMIPKTVKKSISCLKVEKPIDYVGLVHVYLTNSNGACVEPLYDESLECCRVSDPMHPYQYYNYDGHSGYGCLDACAPYFSVSQTEKTFQFSSNVGEAFDKAIIQYYSCPVDEKGMPLVPSFCREAVWSYVTYKYYYMIRNQHINAPSRYNPVNLGHLTELRSNWKIERASAEGILASPMNSRQVQEIGDALMYEVSNAYPPRLVKCYRSFFNKKCKI